MDFDPNNSAPENSGLFALPFTVDEARIVIVPAPWDATSSQERTSSGAPAAVFAASKYVELFDPIHGAFYRHGIAADAIDAEISELNRAAVEMQGRAGFCSTELSAPCERLNQIVFARVAGHLHAGKSVGLLGGDHSVSFGAIQAQLQKYPDMGVLQIDAHCDLRSAFDGIRYSHASIMYNVLERLGLERLVQVGVRGLCDFEAQYVETSPRVVTFFDADLYRKHADGDTWSTVCKQIVDELPERVYISLDIDGLAPAWCPHTGTPVPGGLSYNDAVYLLQAVKRSGRQIVGFDLVEVGNDPFDAAVAAHLLYQLCALLPDATTDS